MLRLLTDENFDQRILRGLRLRLQQLDCVVVQQAGMAGATDDELLDWSAKEGRVIITHDVNTMPGHATARLILGHQMSGLIVVPDRLEIGRTIEDLEVIIECAAESDVKDRIYYLPL